MRKLWAAVAALLLVAGVAGASTNYPGSVDTSPFFGTIVHGAPVANTTMQNVRDAILALETKVGKDSSAVTSSIDYLLKNSGSVDPGHTHTGASLSAINAATITTGTLPDARLSANIPRLNVTNVFSVLQTFGAGISVTGNATVSGTVTGGVFSGSGASLTNIPETAITDGAILARLADNETVTGSWTFSSPPTASGANLSNIPETAITDGALLARVADNESISGTWSFIANIAKIRNVAYFWPVANSSGQLTNDGAGNLTWTASAGTTPGGGAGAVQFNFGGVFTGDATNFFWDSTNFRLGIGTNTPAVPLHVVGTVRSTAVAGVGNRCLEADSSGNVVATLSTCATATGASGANGSVQFAFGGAFASDATNFFWDDATNRLGIGTNTPATALDVATGTITSGHHLPTTDDNYDLGSPTFRWANLHLGPSSLVIHNDATDTDKTSLAYVSGKAQWSATAGTPLKMFASAVAGTSPLQFTADTTSGTSSTSQFFFQMANTGAPNVNPLRGLYVAEPANSFTGAQTNLFVEDATKASGAKYSAEFAGVVSVYRNLEVGDANVGGARLAIDNGAASHGAAGTILQKLKQHASQSGNVFQVQTSSDNVQWAIGANGFTVMGGVNATIGTDRLRVIGSTSDSSANALLVQNSGATGQLFRVRNDGQSTFGGTVLPDTDNTYDLGSTASRWASIHVGPGSLVVHDDNTNTLKMSLAFSAGTAKVFTDAATPLLLTTGSNAGININTSGQIGLATTPTIAGSGTVQFPGGSNTFIGDTATGGAFRVYGGTGNANDWWEFNANGVNMLVSPPFAGSGNGTFVVKGFSQSVGPRIHLYNQVTSNSGNVSTLSFGPATQLDASASNTARIVGQEVSTLNQATDLVFSTRSETPSLNEVLRLTYDGKMQFFPATGTGVFEISSPAENQTIVRIQSQGAQQIINELRQADVSTTDGTATTLSTFPTDTDHNYLLHTKVIARQTGGVAGTVGDAGGFDCYATYRNVSGVLTEVGDSCTITQRDDATWTVDFAPSGTNILLRVTGATDKNIDWMSTTDASPN